VEIVSESSRPSHQCLHHMPASTGPGLLEVLLNRVRYFCSYLLMYTHFLEQMMEWRLKYLLLQSIRLQHLHDLDINYHLN